MFDGETSIWTGSSHREDVSTLQVALENGSDLHIKRASEDKTLSRYVNWRMRIRIKPCPHYKLDSMRIHGSGLNPLPIRFDRVRTIVLQSELDPDEWHVYACDLDRRR